MLDSHEGNTRNSADLSNVTTVVLDNSTKLNSFFTASRVRRLERVLDGTVKLSIAPSLFALTTWLCSVVSARRDECIYS